MLLSDEKRVGVGLMSGTSGDGIDAACVEITGHGLSMKVRFLWHHHEPFSPDLRQRLLRIMAPAKTTTQDIAGLHADLGDAFAFAAEKAIARNASAEKPSFIGLAGQTVCHLPGSRGKTVTFQLADAARVAERTGLTTVFDFRQSDVAAGGQGAPLVPWTDWLLLTHPTTDRVIQNIGGIGNATWLPAKATEEQVLAFDTGPGNMIIDEIVSLATGGAEQLDHHGQRAARGRIRPEILDDWLNHPYLQESPPKTTGRETFGRPFVENQLGKLQSSGGSPDDWIATATAFTACSIAQAYRRFLPGFKNPALTAETEIIICGGGACNKTLLAMLAENLPNVRIRHMDELGIPTQAKEALSFALLAAACLDEQPANLPRVTGARHPAILGSIIHRS